MNREEAYGNAARWWLNDGCTGGSDGIMALLFFIGHLYDSDGRMEEKDNTLSGGE